MALLRLRQNLYTQHPHEVIFSLALARMANISTDAASVFCIMYKLNCCASTAQTIMEARIVQTDQF
jgi:hypothetical protein